MRKYIYSFLIYCLCCIQAIDCYGDNKAIYLDGKDNNVRTGIGILSPPWSIEAWVKSDEDAWKDQEVIIGGGEYSDINWVDNLPLVIRKGKVHSHQADLWSKETLDKQWHHLAVTCDEKQTSLLIDGVVVDQADTTISILPGAIGVKEVEPSFGGSIDEVRIWKSALSPSTIRQWMGCPINNAHPDFRSLWAYYPLDDFDGETSVNWVGKGHQAYHIRNGRSDYYGKADVAYPVTVSNPDFKNYEGKQRLFNSVVIHNEWDADQGQKDAQILKLRIAVQGKAQPMKLNSIKLDLSKTTSLQDIERIHVYYTGDKATSKKWIEINKKELEPHTQMKLDFRDQTGIWLQEGINYFLLSFDLKKNAVPGHIIHADIPEFELDNQTFIPENTESHVLSQISLNSRCADNIVRVLQWNIWHGGVHIAHTGQQRILKLIRMSQADVVMMQEAYGIQQMLADSLKFHLKTHSPKDNLAMYSRYPITPIAWREPFKSNPGKITLPCGKTILFADCWLRYAYRPEYTSGYANSGLNPDTWVAEDSTLALQDIKQIIEKDVDPNSAPDIPVILTGDFNSCSHLDWTERARHLHYGYGPVDFPVSRYMLSQGFTDSFRSLHPDEVNWQCGTVSAIWGQMQMSRIDFIYYRGDALKAISSKVIRTSPDIDDVWPSDHAAVITTFAVVE